MGSRAYTLGVINGALVVVVMSLVRPDLVLSAYVLRLSGSTFLAALPSAMMHLGMLWPQLIVANVAEGMPHKKPIYALANFTRVLMLMLMGLATFLLDVSAPLALALLCLLCMFVFASGAGASSIAFMDIVARTVPASRRGSFMGMRGVYGGALGLGAGFFIRFMLGDDGPAFPANYAVLFVSAAFILAVASVLFMMVREPPPAGARARSGFVEHLRRGADILRQDLDYRRLVTVRAMVGLTALGQVVLIPYAIKRIGLPESIVGELMILAALFSLPANLLWSRISDRRGNRLLIRVAVAAALIAPALALISAWLPGWTPGGSPAVYNLPAVACVLAFVMGVSARRGCMMGTTNYLLEIAPDNRRPTYLAFMRILQAPPSLLAPVIGGTVAQWVSFEAAFALSCGAAAATFLLAGVLAEPRLHSKT